MSHKAANPMPHGLRDAIVAECQHSREILGEGKPLRLRALIVGAKGRYHMALPDEADGVEIGSVIQLALAHTLGREFVLTVPDGDTVSTVGVCPTDVAVVVSNVGDRLDVATSGKCVVPDETRENLLTWLPAASYAPTPYLCSLMESSFALGGRFELVPVDDHQQDDAPSIGETEGH